MVTTQADQFPAGDPGCVDQIGLGVSRYYKHCKCSCELQNIVAIEVHW